MLHIPRCVDNGLLRQLPPQPHTPIHKGGGLRTLPQRRGAFGAYPLCGFFYVWVWGRWGGWGGQWGRRVSGGGGRGGVGAGGGLDVVHEGWWQGGSRAVEVERARSEGNKKRICNDSIRVGSVLGLQGNRDDLLKLGGAKNVTRADADGALRMEDSIYSSIQR